VTDLSSGRPLPGAPSPSRPGERLFHHLVGLAILVLNKLRHDVRGYRTPRPFSAQEVERAVAYDLGVVEHWMRALRGYVGEAVSLRDQRVLELGPGADLGVGLVLLAKGAASYHALEATRAGRNDRLDYRVRGDFDLRVLGGADVDFVFSQAVFEHFDDPDDVLARLADVVRPGAVLVAEIDLKTHTRWLRERDPLNIYGSPNRWRPPDYEASLARHGWTDVQITPGDVLPDAYVAGVRPSLAPRFRSEAARMEVLNLVLCATKG
jgi:SAM-dependent methyltransferase